VSSFGWLLDLLPVATPAPEGVAAGVAKGAAAGSREKRSVDEVPHLPHLPHPRNSEGGTHAAATESEQYARAREGDLAERLTERAAILEFDGGLDRTEADVVAVRIVQCSTCMHWTADPLRGGGIGTCATGADAGSWSAHDRRPVSPWPDAQRQCTGWEGVSHG